MNDRSMNIFDAKAIFGMIGTAFSGVLVCFQETIILFQKVPHSDITMYIPLIPAIPTAIYMIIKAYNTYRDGKNRRDNYE